MPITALTTFSMSRGWGECEVLTLNIVPLDLLDSEDYDDDNESSVQMRDYSEALNVQTVQQLGQLQQLGLCLARQKADHDERDPEKWDEPVKTVIGLPWVQALLTAPCALRLLSLEIYYLPALPHFEGLQHLLLFVRRRILRQVCLTGCMQWHRCSTACTHEGGRYHLKTQRPLLHACTGVRRYRPVARAANASNHRGAVCAGGRRGQVLRGHAGAGPAQLQAPARSGVL